MTYAHLVVYLIFLLSGVAGLIYEVVWAKYLSLLLGNTSYAHTIVLGTFMGGLALGYFLFGKISDRVKSALNLYGWMELAIGLLGTLFLQVFEWLGSAYILLARLSEPQGLSVLGIKFLLAVLVLLPPSILMGGTLPVLSKFVIRSWVEIEARVASLYFVNSLGAAAGSILAGFILIPRLGLALSVLFAVALNLFSGFVALAMRAWEQGEKGRGVSRSIAESSAQEIASSFQVRLAVLGVFLSGGAALIYEIAWIRLLSLVLGSSVYSFSLMLAAFITGIAFGSFVVSCRWVRRFDPFVLFGFAELGVALSVVLTLPLYERLPFYFALLANLFVRVPETFWLSESIKFLVSFLLMFLPTFFLGMTLPLVSQVAARSPRSIGNNIGVVFAGNTLGTLIGAAAAGLFLLPLLGIKRLIELGVLINLVVGVFTLGASSRLPSKTKAWSLGPVIALFGFYLFYFPSWDKVILSSGAFRMAGFNLRTTYREFRNSVKDQILYYKDGANVTVSVTRSSSGHLLLKVNGKTDASTRRDLPTEILLGQVPLLLKPDARNVLVIGLGSGITAGSVLSHPVRRVDVVEIAPEVVEASRLFTSYNNSALKDSRLSLHQEDAKTYLKIAPRRYDVIISEPSNPWIAGVGNLFSVEFYQDVLRQLEPDGLMAQWFHYYEMTDETLRLVLRTFTSSFQHVTLWNTAGGDLLLVGSKVKPRVDFQMSLSRFHQKKVREDLGRLGINSFATVLSLQLSSDEGVRNAAGKGAVNEDLFPILEYEAPKAFFLSQTSQIPINIDERRHPRPSTPLYFSLYSERNRMGPPEIKDIVTYHLARHASHLDLARAFAYLWLSQSPMDPEARWVLAQIEELSGNLEGALKEVEYLLSLDSNRVEYLEAAARLQFGVYLARRSLVSNVNPQKALNYLHRLLELRTDQKDRIYRFIARIYLTDREYHAALRYFDKAATHSKANGGNFTPDILWLEAANVALEMNDPGLAIDFVIKALSANPDNYLAKETLGRLRKLAGEERPGER